MSLERGDDERAIAASQIYPPASMCSSVSGVFSQAVGLKEAKIED
jgi:hypothetical protein